MTAETYIEWIRQTGYIRADSEAHACMHRMARKAQTITARLNNGCRSPGKRRRLFSKLIGKRVDASFSLFPPFYTDCGKNISVGKNVFINAGCCFQDQGGIAIGDGALIGHQVVLATLNHDLNPERR